MGRWKTMSYKSESKNLHEKLYGKDDKPVIEDEYLLKRFEQSVLWYIKNANNCKIWYFALSIVGIVLPLSIPILNLFNDSSYVKLLITLVSVFTSFVTALLSLLKSHDKWINYRSVAEALQTELTLYISKCGDYVDSTQEERNQLFAERIETLMGNEHIKWIGIVNKKSDDKKSN